MKANVYILALLAVAGSCAPKKKDARPALDTSDNVKRTYFKSGKVNTEISYKDGEKDGVARIYYINGNVNQEIVYKRGKRDGLAKRFYENGKVYQETQYVDDKMNGYRKKFDQEGRLISEEIYRNDFACRGLKEYNGDGSLRSSYPKLIIQSVDRISQEGKFYLNLTLSDKSKKVKYYKGTLTSDGCISSALEPILLIENKGMGQLIYYMPPGSFKMEEVRVIAVVQTTFGSSYIAQNTYNLSIDN
jgi:hypothetical protein